MGQALSATHDWMQSRTRPLGGDILVCPDGKKRMVEASRFVPWQEGARVTCVDSYVFWWYLWEGA